MFGANYFDSVSVAGICRTAEVSNGVFYRYYRDKEQIFEELLDDFLENFGNDLAAVHGDSNHARLNHFVEVVTGAAGRYAGQVTMFREGQYRKPDYEARLRTVYIESVNRILGRTVQEAEYLFLLSGVRFVATRALYHELPIHVDVLTEIIERGLFAGRPSVVLADSVPVPQERRIDEDGATRFLEAGMRLFGTAGFFSVQVTDICREAGLSVGSFYKRYESKTTFLSEIVREIGRRTRHFLTEHAYHGANPLDREIVGMWNFLGFFRVHREYYSIVREAEFVAPRAVKEYYDAFERGYMRHLDVYDGTRRRDAANFLMGLSHYLGIEVLFSDRGRDSRALVQGIGRLLAGGIGEGKEDQDDSNTR